MKVAMIGLGKMGGNMTRRLLEHGHEMVVFDLSPEVRAEFEKLGATSVASIDELAKACNEKNVDVVWSMLPAGEITNNTIIKMATEVKTKAVIVDGGNSFYKDTMELGNKVKELGHDLVDAGTSGGVWGLKNGYCFMAGGTNEAFAIVEPILKDLAAVDGYAHMGPVGSGHFVKMVHNGIEYAMMQSYGEGFEILKAKEEFNLDLESISKVWQHGSVINSWLLELCEDMFSKDKNLDGIKGYVADSGEGRWTVLQAIEDKSYAPLITMSLINRFRSRKDETFTDKVIAGLRDEFGGHGFQKK